MHKPQPKWIWTWLVQQSQSFDANLNAAIDESMLFGNMMEQASQSLLLTFGADSPIYSQMMSEMMMAGRVSELSSHGPSLRAVWSQKQPNGSPNGTCGW